MKYLGILLLAMLAASGATGVSYANWQQDIVVAGTVETGDWTSADYAAIDATAAPDCTLDSQSIRSVTFKIHFKDNSRHSYSGYIVCPVVNNGTIPVVVDTVQVSKMQITESGPDRDPSAADLSVTPTGALVEADHALIDAGRSVLAGVSLSGNPHKGDYYVTVSFATALFNHSVSP